ncbi:SMP-30/gluconolactonase/LRE family protein, partial [Dietzia aerolata]
GRLWVSKTFLNRVDAYDDDGNIIATASVRSPGGIDLGPDGRMHVAAGTGYLAQRSDVVSFDPSAGRPGEAIEAGAGAPIEVRVEARLDNRKNGLAVDAAGNRYLTSLEDDGLTKVRPDGTVDEEWSAAARLGVSNGIAISGDTAYVSQSTDRTVVHAVPLDAPGEWTTTELTAPPTMPRGLDDLAVTDEALLVTSWSSGEVYRIDRDSGEVCVLVGGIPRATSVVVADGFTGSGAESVPDGFDPGDLLVTSLHGPIRHVSLG